MSGNCEFGYHAFNVSSSKRMLEFYLTLSAYITHVCLMLRPQISMKTAMQLWQLWRNMAASAIRWGQGILSASLWHIRDSFLLHNTKYACWMLYLQRHVDLRHVSDWKGTRNVRRYSLRNCSSSENLRRRSESAQLKLATKTSVFRCYICFVST